MYRLRLSFILLAIIAVVQAPSSLKNVRAGAGESPIFVKHIFIPVYPPLARQAIVQGDVRATVQLREDGSVESVIDLAGPSMLQGSTAMALRGWRFGNVPRRGLAISITFRYTLRGPADPKILVHEVSGDLPDQIEIIANPFPSDPFPGNKRPNS